MELEILSAAARSDLASYLIVVGVIWKTMGKKVSAHFKGMEDAVRKLTNQVELLHTDLTDAVRQTGSRLDAVELGMVQLRGRVTSLEEPNLKGK